MPNAERRTPNADLSAEALAKAECQRPGLGPSAFAKLSEP